MCVCVCVCAVTRVCTFRRERMFTTNETIKLDNYPSEYIYIYIYICMCASILRIYGLILHLTILYTLSGLNNEPETSNLIYALKSTQNMKLVSPNSW